MLASVAYLALVGSKDPNLSALKTRLDAACAPFRGRIGYSLTLLNTGKQINLRGNERFPTASTIKTALALEAIRQVDEGKLKWTDKRRVPPMEGRQASMWSYHFKEGTELDVDGWVNLTLTVSDNTATMLLRDWLSPESVNRRMEGMGLPNTKILWSNFAPNQPDLLKLRRTYGLGVTTPNEMNRLLVMLHQGRAASAAGSDRLIRILGKQYWDDAIGSSVPVDVRVASKSGAIDRSRSDTAIVYSRTQPYVLTIYTDAQKDQRWSSDNEGDLKLRELAFIVWNALHPQRPHKLPKNWERFAPTGGGV